MSVVYLLSLKVMAGPHPLLDQAAPQKGSSDGGQRIAGPAGRGGWSRGTAVGVRSKGPSLFLGSPRLHEASAARVSWSRLRTGSGPAFEN